MWRRAWIRRWDSTAYPPFLELRGRQHWSSLIFQEASLHLVSAWHLSAQRFQVSILPRKKLRSRHRKPPALQEHLAAEKWQNLNLRGHL